MKNKTQQESSSRISTKQQLALFFVVFIPALLVYALTAGRTVYWHDSGIYLTALHCMGVPYAPGFPFYLITAKPFTWLAPLFGFPFSVHLYSAVCAAVASSVIALLILRINRRGFWIAASVGMATAFSYTLWFQAVNAEVYASHAMLTALFFFLVFSGPLNPAPAEKTKSSFKIFVWLCVVYGLSFGNHPMTVSLFPLFLFALFHWHKSGMTIRKTLTGLAIFVVSGFVPFLILPILALRDPYLLQGDVLGVNQFFRHITATSFVSNESSFLWSNARFAALGKEYFLQFFLVGIALAFAGVWADRKNSRFLISVTLAVVPISLMAIVYKKGFEWDMWLLTAYLAMAILIGRGALWIGDRFRFRYARSAVAAGIALFIVLPQLIVNFPLIDRHDDKLPEDYGKNLLRNLDSNAVFIVRTDSACSTVAYCQEVLNFRSDVTAIWEPYLPALWYREFLHRKTGLKLALNKKGVTLDEAIARLFVECKKAGRPLFHITIPAIRPVKGLYFKPAGAMFQLTDEPSGSIEMKYWKSQYSDSNWHKRKTRNHAERVYTDQQGITKTDRTPYHKDALDFEIQKQSNLGKAFFDAKRFDQAAVEYEKAIAFAEGEGTAPLLAKVAESYYLGRDERARDALLKAVEANPDYIPGYLYLGEWARIHGDIEKAQNYYERVLKSNHPQLIRIARDSLRMMTDQMQGTQ